MVQLAKSLKQASLLAIPCIDCTSVNILLNLVIVQLLSFNLNACVPFATYSKYSVSLYNEPNASELAVIVRGYISV